MADILGDRKRQIQLDGMRRQRKPEEQSTKFWEAMSELELLDAQANPKNPGAVTLLTDLQKGVQKSTAEK